MNLSKILPNVEHNASTLLLSLALHYAAGDKVSFKGMDADAMAIALTGLMNQLEAEHPGICEKYDWARLSALEATGKDFLSAGNATAPDRLK